MCIVTKDVQDCRLEFPLGDMPPKIPSGTALQKDALTAFVDIVLHIAGILYRNIFF